MRAMQVAPLTGRDDRAELLVKLESTRCYRIRIVGVREGAEQSYSVGAVRCGNSQEIELLSGTTPSPSEAATWMREGFSLREDASDTACVIVAQLNENSSAGVQRVA